MARNLRAKIPEADEMYIFDVNAASTEELHKELNHKNLHIAKDPKEVAQKSVRASPSDLT